MSRRRRPPRPRFAGPLRRPGASTLTDPDTSNSSSDDGPRSDGEPPSAASIPTWVCQIDIQNPCRYPDVGARLLRPLVSSMVRELAPGARSFALRFISDREMRRLNATYRHKDRPTDVLSFPGDLTDAAPSAHAEGWQDGAHLGDVAISIPTARRQAEERGDNVAHEIGILVLHGILHCLGYDHEEDDGEMERLELELRGRFLGKETP